MRKILVFISLFFVLFIVYANNSSMSLDNIVFQNLQMPKTSVKKALKLNNRTSINLEGKIIKSLGNGKFKFEDNTSNIVIVINDDILSESNIVLNKLVKIKGEVVKKGRKNVFYVDKLEF